MKSSTTVIKNLTWHRNSPHGVHLQGVKQLITKFASTIPDRRGYFFTLNQDLFIERWYGKDTLLKVPVGRPHLPDIHHNQSRTLENSDYLTVPDSNQTDRIGVEDKGKTSSSGFFHYLKLHGSVNWLSSDNKRVMVIGGRKREQIHDEPLLEYYFKTFQKVLSQPSRRLCVIGYGFRDKHINGVIGNALLKHGLRLYVISPRPRTEIRRELRKTNIFHGGSLTNTWSIGPGHLKKSTRPIRAEQSTPTRLKTLSSTHNSPSALASGMSIDLRTDMYRLT